MTYRVVTTELTTPLDTLEEAQVAKKLFEDMYPNATHKIVRDSEGKNPDPYYQPIHWRPHGGG